MGTVDQTMPALFEARAETDAGTQPLAGPSWMMLVRANRGAVRALTSAKESAHTMVQS